jgi:hypothetical protein
VCRDDEGMKVLHKHTPGSGYHAFRFHATFHTPLISILSLGSEFSCFHSPRLSCPLLISSNLSFLFSQKKYTQSHANTFCTTRTIPEELDLLPQWNKYVVKSHLLHEPHPMSIWGCGQVIDCFFCFVIAIVIGSNLVLIKETGLASVAFEESKYIWQRRAVQHAGHEWENRCFN